MEAYQQRVVDEKRELDKKICKLSEFMKTERFHILNQEEQYLMKSQLSVMNEYSSILGKRIDTFKAKQAV